MRGSAPAVAGSRSGNRPVLLIGGNGLVGRHVAAAMPAQEIFVTERRPSRSANAVLDITDGPAVARLIDEVRPRAIVVAAAEAWVERCEREPALTRAVNVDAPRLVAERAERHDALLVVFSSEYVFDGTSGPYRGPEPVHPINEYGRQKVELEAIARSTRDHLICRTSGVFGWEPARKNFVCQIVDALRAGRRFPVPADQVITPTYAPDLATAVAELLAAEARGTAHVVGPEIMPRVDFAHLVSEVFGLDDGLLEPRPTTEIRLLAKRPLNAGLSDESLRRYLARGLRPLRAALVEMRGTEPPHGADRAST